MSIEITGIFAGIVSKKKGDKSLKSPIPYWIRKSTKDGLNKLKVRTNSKDYDELLSKMITAVNKGLDLTKGKEK